MNAQKRYKYLISNILKQNKLEIKEVLPEVVEVEKNEIVAEESKVEEVIDTLPEVEQEVKVTKKKKSI